MYYHILYGIGVRLGGNSCSGSGFRWKRGAGTLVLYRIFRNAWSAEGTKAKKERGKCKSLLGCTYFNLTNYAFEISRSIFTDRTMTRGEV